MRQAGLVAHVDGTDDPAEIDRLLALPDPLDAVESVWMQTAEDVTTAGVLCSALVEDPDRAVCTGARELFQFTRTGQRP